MEIFIKGRVDQAYREICKWLDQHVSRLTGENRYLCSYSRLRSRFPEFEEEVMMKVWERLKNQGRVKLDPLDGEWIVAKG